MGVLTPLPIAIGSTTSGLSSMYSSIEEPISSPALTLDITNIIVIIKYFIFFYLAIGPIAAAYFALPVALAAEMLAPTAVEEVAGAAVGETMATVTPETMAEFSSAFEQIMELLSISYFFISVVIIVLLQWRLGIYCLGRRL
jgi:hypothetical protein